MLFRISDLIFMLNDRTEVRPKLKMRLWLKLGFWEMDLKFWFLFPFCG